MHLETLKMAVQSISIVITEKEKEIESENRDA